MPAADPAPSPTQWLVADPARVALLGRARREVAAADLFLPLDGRLRDDDRVTIARLLADLTGAVERVLRRQLAEAFADRPMLAESLASSRIPIAAPILERSGALRDPAIVATLARRAEEGRLIARLRLARRRDADLEARLPVDPLALLVGDDDGAVAAAARRFDAAARIGRDAVGAPLLAEAELPAEAQHRLVWQVAAALRDYVVASQAADLASIDAAIARAAEAALAGYDEGETLAGLARALARALHLRGRLDDGWIVAVTAYGEPALAAAALSVRIGVEFAPAWDMMVDPDAGRLLLLCRGAGMAVEMAADLMLRLSTGEDDDALADRLDAYGTLTPQRAYSALTLFRLDRVCPQSIAALAPGGGR